MKLSFAQFEREVIGERIRDKVAASRRRGIWMGGYVPLGYDVQDRKLVVNEAEAANVRRIFQRFIDLGSASVLARELRGEGFRSKQGTLIDKGYLYRLLNNRVYRGEALHKGKAYPGEHDAIIDADLWDRVRAILQESPRKRANNSRAQTPALLKGLIFSENGAAMTPTSTKKGARLYRYYVSMDVIRNRETGEETAPMRLAAGMVEDAIVTEVRRILQTPEVVTQVLAALKRDSGGMASEADAIAALREFNALWSQLFPAEQARIIQLLVRRVTFTTAGLEVDIRREGPSKRSPRDGRAAPDGGRGMTKPDDTIRVLIPLNVRKKNGRPKILPPVDYRPSEDQAQDPHILRAIGRAWGWRRRMEAGEFATIQELAETVGLAERHVSRQLRLAYLAPEVLKRLTCGREASAVSLYDLCFLAGEAWAEQLERAVGE